MLRQALLLFSVLIVPLGGATGAPAPSGPSEAAKNMVGKWEFADASGDRTCKIIFRTDAGAVGMKLEFEPACYGLFPFIKEIVGWRLADGDFLRMYNARGKSVLEFSEGGEVGNRMFEAPRPGEGVIRIQEIGAVVTDVTPEQMNGEWTMQRGSGRTLCTLSLSGAAVGENFALKLNPGCNAAALRFTPVSWRMDRGGLTLISARGDTWLFEADDAVNWHSIPQTADPILLVRK